MYDLILKKFNERKDDPVDVLVVGLGFVSFGFLSSIQTLPGIRVPLVITRRPSQAKEYLEKRGSKAQIESSPSKIKDYANRGYICISDDLGLIKTFDNEVVIEMTGTVAYGAEAAVAALSAKKHLVTMNPELQATVGQELKALADKQGVITTDVIGDQPGSLARLVTQAQMMGFKVRVAGNMKRFLNHHATQSEMQPWADDKGISVRQTTSFTDGTKQAIEMNLVANYFDMDISEFGMKGPRVETVQEALDQYPWNKIPEEGIVDYVIGNKLFPGVFIIAEHSDKHQKGYLRYLGLGEGPRYVLFEPYHLCHLEVAGTIAKVVFFGQETINNRVPKTQTITLAKFDLKKGDVLDGIGGDKVYGNIDRASSANGYLPVGLSDGAVVKHDLHQDQPIKLSDVVLPENAATKLVGQVKKSEKKPKPAVSKTPFPPFSPFLSGMNFLLTSIKK